MKEIAIDILKNYDYSDNIVWQIHLHIIKQLQERGKVRWQSQWLA